MNFTSIMSYISYHMYRKITHVSTYIFPYIIPYSIIVCLNFKYVDVDLCTFSFRSRMKLKSLGQPRVSKITTRCMSELQILWVALYCSHLWAAHPVGAVGFIFGSLYHSQGLLKGSNFIFGVAGEGWVRILLESLYFVRVFIQSLSWRSSLEDLGAKPCSDVWFFSLLQGPCWWVPDETCVWPEAVLDPQWFPLCERGHQPAQPAAEEPAGGVWQEADCTAGWDLHWPVRARRRILLFQVQIGQWTLPYNSRPFWGS